VLTSDASGIATWLGTPSSANLASAVTDETGTGALVFATNPTIAGLTGTGVWDLGGATSFEIVNGASPTVDTLGEIALDTTDNQLLIATSTTPAVIRTTQRLFSFSVASTSPEFVSGGIIPLPSERDGYRSR